MFILYNPSDKSSPNSLNPDLVWASSMAQTVKNPPAMWETWAQSLDQKDPLEQDLTTHSSILVWKIPIDRGAWQAIIHGVAKNQT